MKPKITHISASTFEYFSVILKSNVNVYAIEMCEAKKVSPNLDETRSDSRRVLTRNLIKTSPASFSILLKVFMRIERRCGAQTSGK